MGRIGIRRYSGTVGSFFDVKDFNGYRGWLTNDTTGTVYMIEEVCNDSIPLKKGDSVYYLLRNKVAFNVCRQ